MINCVRVANYFSEELELLLRIGDFAKYKMDCSANKRDWWFHILAASKATIYPVIQKI